MTSTNKNLLGNSLNHTGLQVRIAQKTIINETLAVSFLKDILPEDFGERRLQAVQELVELGCYSELLAFCVPAYGLRTSERTFLERKN